LGPDGDALKVEVGFLAADSDSNRTAFLIIKIALTHREGPPDLFAPVIP
jgi:hypothetical protein